VKGRRLLLASRHAVFRLTPDLLLVFKPRGHHEKEHSHPHRQRLRVLSGQIEVRTGKRTIVLRSNSRPLMLAAGRAHVTLALEETWLIAESLPG
jgi:quercetin dioxygenase-like cupin family protein